LNAIETKNTSLDFTLDEYNGRLSKVRAELSARNADMLLVDQLDHIAYLFGYLPTAARYQAAFIPVEGEPYLVVRELDLGTFLDQSWSRNYETFADDEDSLDKVARALSRLGPKRLAIEKDSNITTVSRLDYITAFNPAVEIIDFSGVLWQLRLIKSEAELDYIREASRTADLVLSAGIGAIAPGRIDRATLSEMYAASIRVGADNTKNAVLGRLGHGNNPLLHASGNPWKAGEIVFLEATPQFRGYSARAIRSVVVGSMTAEAADKAKRLIDIQDQQLKAIRPGATASDVDAICRNGVVEAGLNKPFSQLTGYTLGYQAAPRASDHTRIIAPHQSWRFEPRMVFHLVICTESMAISDTIVVTENGADRLTKTDRKLFST
jgi:Xaa-Pro aminopeptidase